MSICFILSAELNIYIVTEKHGRLLVEQCGRKQEMEYEVRIRKGTTAASTEREVPDRLEGRKLDELRRRLGWDRLKLTGKGSRWWTPLKGIQQF